MSDSIVEERALLYAALSGIVLDLKTPLGHGTDGSVWKSDKQTAVKSLERQKNYSIELECYRRFEMHGITRIQGLAVPQLIGFNDDLWVIEMRLVTAPFILDFAKAWLDAPPDFPRETMDEWDQEGRERFGERWPKVLAVLRALRPFGIYYYDAKPANIDFSHENEA